MFEPAKLALASFDCLDRAGVSWCLLHGLDKISNGEISDVDIAVDGLSKRTATEFFKHLNLKGLFVIGVWPSSFSNVNLFISTRDLSNGFQLDITYDRAGKNSYGLLSKPVVDASERLGPVQHASQLDSWLYSLRKRAWKTQPVAVNNLLQRPPADHEQLAIRANEIFRSDHAEFVVSLLDEPTRPLANQPRYRGATRRLRRAVRPTGFWAHLASPSSQEQALELQARLSRLLRYVVLSNQAPLPLPATWLRLRHLSTLARGGAVVSYGKRRVPRGSLILSESGIRRNSEALVNLRRSDTLRQFIDWMTWFDSQSML
jgi:hypothetical protein